MQLAVAERTSMNTFMEEVQLVICEKVLENSNPCIYLKLQRWIWRVWGRKHVDEIIPDSWLAFVCCCNVTQCHGHRFSGSGIPRCGQCVLPLPLPFRKVCQLFCIKSWERSEALTETSRNLMKPHGYWTFQSNLTRNVLLALPDLAFASGNIMPGSWRPRRTYRWEMELWSELHPKSLHNTSATKKIWLVMVKYCYCRVQRQRLHSNRMSTRTYHNSAGLNSFAPDLRLWCCHLSGVRSAKKSCGRPGITCWIWMESVKLPLSESTRSITKTFVKHI